MSVCMPHPRVSIMRGFSLVNSIIWPLKTCPQQTPSESNLTETHSDSLQLHGVMRLWRCHGLLSDLVAYVASLRQVDLSLSFHLQSTQLKEAIWGKWWHVPRDVWAPYLNIFLRPLSVKKLYELQHIGSDLVELMRSAEPLTVNYGSYPQSLMGQEGVQFVACLHFHQALFRYVSIGVQSTTFKLGYQPLWSISS